ncbi:MAG: hypothetical protein ACPGTG_03055, partial [Flavobacteriales bacterium]
TETKPEIVLETDNIWSDEVQSNDNQVLDKEEEKVTLPFKEINTSGRSIGLNLIRLQNANPNEEPKSLMKVRVPEYTLASKTYQALYIDHNAGRSSTHSIKEVVSINYELIFTPNTLLKLKDVASLLRKNKTLSCVVVFNNRIVKPNDTSGLEFCSQRILKNLNQKHGISKSRLMIFHSSSKLNQFDNVVVLHVDEQPKKVR